MKTIQYTRINTGDIFEGKVREDDLNEENKWMFVFMDKVNGDVFSYEDNTPYDWHNVLKENCIDIKILD